MNRELRELLEEIIYCLCYTEVGRGLHPLRVKALQELFKKAVRPAKKPVKTGRK